jgi:hypothetical protein
MSRSEARGPGESSVRKALVLTTSMAVGIGLASCSEPQSPTVLSPATTVPPPRPIERERLAPTAGYEYSQPPTNSPTALGAYASSQNQHAEPQTSSAGVWHSSPSWSAVKGDSCFAVEQTPQDDSSARSEAGNFSVEKCSKKDADTKPHPALEISGY